MLSVRPGWRRACAGAVAAVASMSGCAPRSSAAEAMREGDDALARVLARGANVNARDSAGYAPIHLAAIGGDVRPMRAVLTHHPDVDARNLKGETALFLAAALGKTECTYLLLTAGADPNVRVVPGSTTPLLEAVARAPAETVRLLLDHGADPNAAGSWGETALHLLARAPSERADAVVPMLAAHGADFERRDIRGYTPLHQAAEYGSLGIIRAYVERNLDLSVVGPTGFAPLDLAVLKHHVVAADVLYRAGARPATNEGFLPPLHRAAKLDEVDDTVLLLASGADPRSVFDGRTPIDLARAAGSARVVAVLDRAFAARP